ncbi:hypothetical protein GSI_12531 [Ganoderma sinense ZZ0214-1]|uniref:Uncharacterized protein n=1 Tax=Ganoderma sinense ZZ0214-1 TaxID=1077348 RepID=A0A2G8RT06_9APHY|nr:hypothetical protein GSI_12531 [Ganoderma sinense ZZ0214-1]
MAVCFAASSVARFATGFAGAPAFGWTTNFAMSQSEQLVGELHVRATNGLPTSTAIVARNSEANATIPSITPPSTSQGAPPSTTSSGIVPAVIAVVTFVVCVFVALRILRAIRLNCLVAAYTTEPDTPRMWEVRLDSAPGPSFEGKWNEIMPLAAQCSAQCDIVSRHPLSRGTSVSTDVSGNQASRRDSGDSSRYLPLTIRRVGAITPVDEACGIPEHVAVLIAMPAPKSHVSGQGRPAKAVGPICIGTVDV